MQRIEFRRVAKRFGELVGGNKGLGYLLVDGGGRGNTAMMFVAIILLTVIGAACCTTCRARNTSPYEHA